MQTRVIIHDLTKENLNDAPSFSGLPYSCKYCLYWESPEDFKKQSSLDREYLLGKKTAWVEKVRREFGDCGKIIYVNEKPAGYAQYALPAFLPYSVNYSIIPDQDAVLIACLYISKELRVSGLGSQLLRSIVN
jgi:Acetyltransferase (GNAT) family